MSSEEEVLKEILQELKETKQALKAVLALLELVKREGSFGPYIASS